MSSETSAEVIPGPVVAVAAADATETLSGTLPDARPYAAPSGELTSPVNREIHSQVASMFETHGKIIFDSSRAPTAATVDALQLTLSKDGRANVEYFGADSETTAGTYRIDDIGRLLLDFGVEDPWLPMQVTIENGALIVNAPTKKEIVQMAIDAGFAADEITDADMAAAFEAWPLRQQQIEPK